MKPIINTPTGQGEGQSNAARLSFRLSDIHKLLKGRYDGPCRDGNAERYLRAAIPEMMPRARSWRYAVSWARDWVPALLDEQGEEYIRQCWIKVTARKRRRLTTDQLARLLKVTNEEPQRLNLRCIPAASRNAETREADRKTKAAERARKNRAKVQGYVPRSESLTAKEPWKAAGISNSTWYARRREEQLAASPLSPETADLDRSVRTVSVATTWTNAFAPDPLNPLRSGHNGSERGGADNDNRPPVASVTAADGWRLTRSFPEAERALKVYPELAPDFEAHLDAVNALMLKTKEPYRSRVARNLLADRGRALRRTAELAMTA